MSGTEKPDHTIVAMKPANGQADVSSELAERRVGAKGNADRVPMVRAQAREAVVSRLDRVCTVARTRKGEKFTTLMTYLDVEMLRSAYGELKRDAAPGVDGVTWWGYAEGLDDRLADLTDRLHRGSYRAQLSRRHFIPKADGRLRPLGIAALEDKMVQRAVVEILNAIFEEDFLDCSYGFRPGRGQHDALDAVAVGISESKVNWILDADIRAFTRVKPVGMLRQHRSWVDDAVPGTPDWAAKRTNAATSGQRVRRPPHSATDPQMAGGRRGGRDGGTQPATIGSPQGR
jgi:RNA-directed DNA polymerase